MKKIVIITAMQEEANHIIELYSLKLIKEFINIKIYGNNNIVLALAWIWKIQASIVTTYLFENYEIDKLINIWIAWNLRWNEVNIWDVFIINKIVQHDMYLPFDWEHLNYAKGIIEIENNINIWDNFEFLVCNNSYCLTWDQFIDNEEKVLELSTKYWANVIEMEAFAVASVALEYGRINDCIFIKAISDWADNEAKDSHMDNLDFAMKNSIEVLKQII